MSEWSPTMPPAAAALVPIWMVLPAAAAAATTFVGNELGALVPKNTVASRSRPAACSERRTCVPDRDAGIVEDVLGDRDDDRDLLDVQVLVRPVDLGGLLEAGVAGDPVGDGSADRTGKRVWARPTGTCVNMFSTALEDGEALQEGVGDLLGHERAGVGARGEAVVVRQVPVADGGAGATGGRRMADARVHVLRCVADAADATVESGSGAAEELQELVRVGFHLRLGGA
jgi:hypothetical protein